MRSKQASLPFLHIPWDCIHGHDQVALPDSDLSAGPPGCRPMTSIGPVNLYKVRPLGALSALNTPYRTIQCQFVHKRLPAQPSPSVFVRQNGRFLLNALFHAHGLCITVCALSSCQLPSDLTTVNEVGWLLLRFAKDSAPSLDSIGFPFTAVIRSPDCSPARSAGPPAQTLVTVTGAEKFHSCLPSANDLFVQGPQKLSRNCLLRTGIMNLTHSSRFRHKGIG